MIEKRHEELKAAVLAMWEEVRGFGVFEKGFEFETYSLSPENAAVESEFLNNNLNQDFCRRYQGLLDEIRELFASPEEIPESIRRMYVNLEYISDKHVGSLGGGFYYTEPVKGGPIVPSYAVLAAVRFLRELRSVAQALEWIHKLQSKKNSHIVWRFLQICSRNSPKRLKKRNRINMTNKAPGISWSFYVFRYVYWYRRGVIESITSYLAANPKSFEMMI